jgi:hypothetical protein
MSGLAARSSRGFGAAAASIGLCVGLSACVSDGSGNADGLSASASRWTYTALPTLKSWGCGDGGRTFVMEDGHRFALFNQGVSYPVWEIELEPDGSANKMTHSYIHDNRTVKVQIPAGDKPRAFTAEYETPNLCGFKYLPDSPSGWQATGPRTSA